VPDSDIPMNYVPDTRLAGIVVFLVKHAGRARSGFTNIHTEQIAALRRTWGTEVIKAVGKNKIGVPEAVNAGWPVWHYNANNVTYAVQKMMTSICEELKTQIDK
jgi:chromosome partitioning protein